MSLGTPITSIAKKLLRRLAQKLPIANEFVHMRDQIVQLRHQIDQVDIRVRHFEAIVAENHRWYISNLLEQRDLFIDGASVKSNQIESNVQIPINIKPIDEYYQLLQQDAPKAFAVWRQLVDANSKAYDGFPLHSCSVEGHPMAEHFSRFLKPYLRGTVLDIGCGPQPIPSYLLHHPTGQIAGIDPLAPPEGHPFLFVQGVAEFLPWPDASFDSVVVSTSLDHVFLLDKAFKEIYRVLRPNGQFITWITFIPGAKEYNPYSPDADKVDDWHMFHFDRPWFERMIAPYFLKRHEFSFCPPEHSCFIAFRKKPSYSALAA